MRVVPRKVWPFRPQCGGGGLLSFQKGEIMSMMFFSSGLFEVFFVLIFVSVIGGILFMLISGITQWN